MAMELLLLPSAPNPPCPINSRAHLPSSSSSSSSASSTASSSSSTSSSSSIAGRFRCGNSSVSRREAVLKAGNLSALAAVTALCSSFVPRTMAEALEATSVLPKAALPGIASTRSWFLYTGDGFSIRVPPDFEDVTEPEDYNAGLSLYGDKVKPKTFAAQFASPDRSEAVSVVIRPSNQLKITFLEAKDVTDFGTLKEASKIFVPGGAKLYSARAIKIKEDEGLRGYYFYEFGVNDLHFALVAAINSGKTVIAAASAPDTRWEEDGVKLRSAAISLSVA
ncbi:tagatose-6-phosphate ketose/aldose isomerase, putative (Mog1/PsbP/DUF1795-like photosystem II reaction center PsbP family protein) [Wolffia australiana]